MTKDSICPVALVVLLQLGTPGWSATEAASTQMQTTRVLDVGPAHAFTRLVSALHPMLQAAGHAEWSSARLQAGLGNAFSFEMRNGGGKVWQEGNLDWGLFLQTRPELEFGCQIERFQLDEADKQSVALQTETAAWEAVRASIDQGVPAVALCPMSALPGAPRDWGLLVGYDVSQETYTIRRHSGEIRVRFDEIAVAFAHGTAYDPQEVHFHVDARGFDAYELWQQAVVSAIASIGTALALLRQSR